ncbi:MAG: thioredoxin-like domain-containing protein [Bacteroidia bacterium]
MNIKYTLLILLSSLGLVMFGQGYDIEIKVKGFEEDTAYLAYHLAEKQYMQDTVAVKNGKIIFKGDKKLEPGIYLVVLPPENNYFEMVIPEGDQEFTMQTTVKDYSDNMKVSGSIDNEKFYINQQEVNKMSALIAPLQEQLNAAGDDAELKAGLEEQLRDLYAKLNSNRKDFAKQNPGLLYSKVIQSMQEPEIPEAPADVEDAQAWRYHYYKKHFFDNVDFSERGLIRTPVFRQRFMRYIEKVVSPHYDSLKLETTRLIEYSRKDSFVFRYMAVELINHYAKSKIMCHDAVYVNLVDLVYRSGDAWWADEEQVKKMADRAERLRHTMCGTITPPVVMTDTEGNTQPLYSVEAPYTVLYFWDYDCGHCRKVTPALAKWYAGADQKNVKVYTVSINGDIEIWKKKLAEYGLSDVPAINVQDHARKTNFGYYYDLQSTPRIFLLDKNKNILAKQISVETLEEILNSRLGKELEEAEKEVNDD